MPGPLGLQHPPDEGRFAPTYARSWDSVRIGQGFEGILDHRGTAAVPGPGTVPQVRGVPMGYWPDKRRAPSNLPVILIVSPSDSFCFPSTRSHGFQRSFRFLPGSSLCSSSSACLSMFTLSSSHLLACFRRLIALRALCRHSHCVLPIAIARLFPGFPQCRFGFGSDEVAIQFLGAPSASWRSLPLRYYVV